MKKEKMLLCLAVMFAMIMTACGGQSSKPETESTIAESNSSAAEEAVAWNAVAEFPVLLTSGGQSADYTMIGSVMKKNGMDFKANNIATSADIADAKTLIVVVGGSSKGLGAAGIDAAGEIARLDELIAAAKKSGLHVIAMHTGGNARRGDLSDKFIAPVFENADLAIVVKAGDTDHMMETICTDKGIPIKMIDSISDVVTVLPEAFK